MNSKSDFSPPDCASIVSATVCVRRPARNFSPALLTIAAFVAATRAFALALALCACVITGAAAKDVKVSGMGIRKCAEWQQWKEAGNGEARAMALEWAQGFIAGHNVYAAGGAGSVVADVKVLIPLLDRYCEKNPDGRLFAGVAEITQSLGGARINIAPRAQPPLAPRPEGKKELGS